jgi:hypothetical protein
VRLTLMMGTPRVSMGMVRDVRSRRSKGISLRHMLANRGSVEACCAASIRQPSRLRTRRSVALRPHLKAGMPFRGRRVLYPKQQNCAIRLYRHRFYPSPVQPLTPGDTRCLKIVSVVKDGYIGHSAHLLEPVSKPREDPPQT